MKDVYRSIEEYNTGIKRKIRTVLDEMVADMISNKKLYPEATELFFRAKKLNILHYRVILPCTKRRKTKQHTLFYHEDFQARVSKNFYYLSEIDFKDFMDLYRDCTANKILLFHQTILYVFERIYSKKYRE